MAYEWGNAKRVLGDPRPAHPQQEKTNKASEKKQRFNYKEEKGCSLRLRGEMFEQENKDVSL